MYNKHRKFWTTFFAENECSYFLEYKRPKLGLIKAISAKDGTNYFNSKPFVKFWAILSTSISENMNSWIIWFDL